MQEKPWEQKTRLQKWLLEIARSEGKVLSLEAATYLTKGSHIDFGSVLQELNKISTYSGDENNLTLEMTKKVCSLEPIQSSWELSEAVVLGQVAYFGEIDFHAFIAQLHYQLQLGLEITLGKEVKKVSSKKLERFRRSGLKPSYFIEGLKELFDLEMKMRSNLSNPPLLFDRFKAKLRLIQRKNQN